MKLRSNGAMLALGLAFGVAAGPAFAQRLTVCASGCDYATLADAVTAAADGDRIDIEAGVLQGGVTIAKRLRLHGAGEHATLLRHGGPVLDLQCAHGETVEVSNLTLTLSGGSGGGIRNAGCRMVLREVLITGNRVHGSAAGIDNAGQAVLREVRVVNNFARVGCGGIANRAGATMQIGDSLIAANSTGIAAGGGICNEGRLQFNGGMITGNAAKEGGGLLNSGEARVQDAAILANTTTRGDGGGVLNTGTLVLRDSLVSGNSAASEQGPGVANPQGRVELKDTLVIDNTVSGDNCSGVGISCPQP